MYRVYRGLYSLKKVDELDPITLGFKAINDYAYLSCETILAKHGLIFQQINYITFVSRKNKRFKISNNNYYCRQLKEEALFNDTGVIKRGQPFNEASLERALADILYFNPRYHIDNSSAVNKIELKRIKRNVYNK